MQPAVASLHLVVVLFAVPTYAGVYAPSLPSLYGNSNDSDEENTLIVFHVHQPGDDRLEVPGTAQTRNGNSDCEDDATWVDQHGDGCKAYALAVSEGQISQEVACGFIEPHADAEGLLLEGDFKGAALHCRGTCGTCPDNSPLEQLVTPAEPDVNKEAGSCVDDPAWADQDGDGCDVYAMHIKSGQISKSIACGFEDAGDALGSGDPLGAGFHCRATCGTCDGIHGKGTGHQGASDNWLLNVAEQIVTESPEYDPAMLSSGEEAVSIQEEKPCEDDPNWIDVDGDGCAAYAKAIATGGATQAEACGRAHFALISGNPGEAAKYCPVTCGNCNLQALDDNNADMKDMIRLLVEQESENILKSADLQEEAAEEEDVPEVITSTTTTTAVKKLPETEVSTNSTWVEYWDPEAEENQEELSHMDLLKMAAEMRPQQSRFYGLMSQ